LDLERGTLEFLGARILVADVDRHAFTRRHADFLRHEGVVADSHIELLARACALATLSAAATTANVDPRIMQCRPTKMPVAMKEFAGRRASAVLLNRSNLLCCQC